jgi:DNA-binding MarR family transcriptional regulator
MEKINFKKEQIPFTQVANQVLNDPNLTFKAKGIYAYLYSKPDGWDFAIDRIAKDSKESRLAVNTGLQELEANGYLLRERQANGRVAYLLQSQMSKIDMRDIEPNVENRQVRKPSLTKIDTVSNKEIKEIKNSSNKEVTQKFSPEVYGMVDLLTDLIKRNNPDWQMRGTVETWASHIDKLHRIDGRTFEQIAYMIKWTQHDQFWSQNILSTEKLREKFNDLIPKLKASAVKLQNERVASAKPKML